MFEFIMLQIVTNSIFAKDYLGRKEKVLSYWTNYPTDAIMFSQVIIENHDFQCVL